MIVLWPCTLTCFMNCIFYTGLKSFVFLCLIIIRRCLWPKWLRTWHGYEIYVNVSQHILWLRLYPYVYCSLSLTKQYKLYAEIFVSFVHNFRWHTHRVVCHRLIAVSVLISVLLFRFVLTVQNLSQLVNTIFYILPLFDVFFPSQSVV